MTQTVAVIDYGSGNLHSVAKAIEYAGQCRVLVTADPKEIQSADRVVLPGVGAMGDCMQGLERTRARFSRTQSHPGKTTDGCVCWHANPDRVW